MLGCQVIMLYPQQTPSLPHRAEEHNLDAVGVIQALMVRAEGDGKFLRLPMIDGPFYWMDAEDA